MAHIGLGSILILGVQDAARPRRGPSPPEDFNSTGCQRISFSPAAADLGHDLEGGPLWQGSSTIVTSLYFQTLNN